MYSYTEKQCASQPEARHRGGKKNAQNKCHTSNNRLKTRKQTMSKTNPRMIFFLILVGSSQFALFCFEIFHSRVINHYELEDTKILMESIF